MKSVIGEKIFFPSENFTKKLVSKTGGKKKSGPEKNTENMATSVCPE